MECLTPIKIKVKTHESLAENAQIVFAAVRGTGRSVCLWKIGSLLPLILLRSLITMSTSPRTEYKKSIVRTFLNACVRFFRLGIFLFPSMETNSTDRIIMYSYLPRTKYVLLTFGDMLPISGPLEMLK